MVTLWKTDDHYYHLTVFDHQKQLKHRRSDLHTIETVDPNMQGIYV